MGLNWLKGEKEEEIERERMRSTGRGGEGGGSKKSMLSHWPCLSSSFFFLLISPSMNKATPASPVNLASAGWL